MKKSLLSLAVTAALGLASTGASAFAEFTVTPPQTPLTLTGTSFIADKMTGNYNEAITTSGSATSGTFDVAIYWQAGQFANTNTNTTYQSNTTGLGVNYGLYIFFTGIGSYSTSGGVTTFTLTPGGAYTLNMDQPLNNASAVTAPVVASAGYSFPGATGTADDIQLATGNAIAGSGTLSCSVGANCGSFGQVQTVSLTAAGKSFFTAPAPMFFDFANANGQFNGFGIVAGTTQYLNGSLDVEFFKTPEPGSLALLGIGMLGLATTWKKRKA